MKKYILSFILMLLICTSAFSGVVRVESQSTYQALSPSLLTLYKGLSLIPSDSYAISTGSQVGNTGVVYETFDANNGSISIWYYPYNWGNATQLRYLFDAYVDANNRISLTVGVANNVNLIVTGNGTTRTASTSFSAVKPFSWNHIVATWSKNVTVNGTNYSYVYLNGSGAGQTSATVAMTSAPSNFYIGSDYLSNNSASGILAYKIMRNWMSSTQVTDEYNAGNGSTEFFTRTPHTIAFGLTSENSTGVSYVHRGKAVSAIADGITEDTIITTPDASRSFIDNDRVIVNSGNGYSSNAIGNTFVDGTPIPTNVNVDDGAGADVGALEKIGVYLTFNGARKATAGNVCDITTGDFSINGWFKVDSIPVANAAIVSKKATIADDTAGYVIFIDTSGFLRWKISKGDASDTNTTTLATSLSNGKWHSFVVNFDRDGNGSIFVDGYIYATDTALTNVGANSITNASSFMLGACTTTASYLSGCISDISICSDLQSAANALTLATNPMVAPADNVVSYWQLVDNAGTTAVKTSGAGGADFTLDSGLMWTQAGFLSRNLLVDGDMRQGSLGAWSRISGATVTKNTTTSISDEQDLKLVNTGAAQGYAGQNIKTAAGEDYYLYGLIKPQITPSATGVERIIDVDGTASMSETLAQYSPTFYNVSGLVGWWKMDEATAIHGTTIVDSSGSGNNGTLSTGDGATEKSTLGVVGKGLSFDGVNDYVDAGNVNYSSLTNTMTISFWVNPAGNQANYEWSGSNIISRHDPGSAYGWGVGINWHGASENYRRRVYFSFYGGGYSEYTWKSNLQLTYGTWYYVALVMGQYSRSMYINAVLDRTDNIELPTGWITNYYWYNNDLCIGRSASYFIGLTDDVRIYNRALSADEIKELYKLGNYTTEVEHCFQTADTDTTVDLTVPSVTSGDIGYWDNVKLVSNLVVNGGCEGAADPPTGWTQETDATVVSDTSPHAGTNCLKVTAGAVNVGAKQTVTLVTGKYYTIVGYVKATAGDTAGIYVDDGDSVVDTIGTTTSTTWTRIRGSFKATGTTAVVYLRGVTNTDVVWFDDIALIRDDIGTVTYSKGSGIIPTNQPKILR